MGAGLVILSITNDNGSGLIQQGRLLALSKVSLKPSITSGGIGTRGCVKPEIYTIAASIRISM